MDEHIKILEQRIERLEEENKKLRASTTIPFEIDSAFRTRFAKSLGLSVSAKGIDTEDRAVNESGSGSYNVLKDPDGFLEVSIGAVIYYIPYYG